MESRVYKFATSPPRASIMTYEVTHTSHTYTHRRGSRWARRRCSRTSCRTTPTALSRSRRIRTRVCPRPPSTPAR
jgi:hypothetical protein